MQRKEEQQNIPFLDYREIFCVLFRQAELPELAKIRQTCRIANQQFNHALFENPAGMLQKLDQLTPVQLHKFLENNGVHANTLLSLVDRFDAAYASYTLLGDISKLDPSRLPDVLKYMREQKMSQLMIDCVEMIHSVYDRPAKNLDLNYLRDLSPSKYYCDSFSNCLDRMASNYLGDSNLGNLRTLFLYLLFRTTRAREQLSNIGLANYAYDAAKEFLRIAHEHALFAKHWYQDGIYMFRSSMQEHNAPTPSQGMITAEIEQLTHRSRAHEAEVSDDKLSHYGVKL